MYAARSLPVSAAATRLAQEAKDEQDIPDEPWRRGRAGTSIGRAVHAVLQVVDLRTGNGLEDIAKASGRSRGSAGPRGRHCPARSPSARQSPRQARAGIGAMVEETPVAGPVGDGIVEGFIDLLFKEEDGFVIVDYKTDALAPTKRSSGRWRGTGCKAVGTHSP